jgi:hypothetical protein
MKTNQKQPVSRYLLLSLLALFASAPSLQVNSLTMQRMYPIKRRFGTKSARAGFIPSSPAQGIRSGAHTGFLLRAEDGGDGGIDRSENEKKKLSTARIGGRVYSKRNNSPNSKDPKVWGLIAPMAAKLWGLIAPMAAILVVGLVLKGVFGGGDSYYYSYTSSVYETTIVGENGRVETSRKESGNVRSNLPDFENNRRTSRRQGERDMLDAMMRDQTKVMDQELSRYFDF